MKLCTRCNTEKPIEKFGVSLVFKDGHKSWCKTCVRARERALGQKSRKRLFEFLGGKCACCGEKRFEFLNLDHVFKKGHEVYKSLNPRRLAIVLYSKIRKGEDIEGFRLLCWNCNCSIGVHGYCPHEKERELEQQTRQTIDSCQSSESVALSTGGTEIC